jgi:hypothetical protein
MPDPLQSPRAVLEESTVTVQLGFEPKSLANGSFPDRDGLALRCLQAVLEYRESLLEL